jgi:hypothetical protein
MKILNAFINHLGPIQLGTAAASTLLLLGSLIGPTDARATFHLALIDEVLTSFDGNANSQFVEIFMIAGGQGIVSNSKLGAFDASGDFLSIVLTVPENVTSGSARRWIMGTSQFASDSGLSLDFTFSGGLPTGGGMVCWGKPPLNLTNPNDYVDCVAYGTYNGPSNSHIGVATTLTADGHSLVRTGDTANNAADFACADLGNPENNDFQTVPLAATSPCNPPACGDATDDGDLTASDALFALNAAVDLLSCALCVCDVDGSGSVTASDALRILNAAVGLPVTLDCPACT